MEQWNPYRGVAARSIDVWILNIVLQIDDDEARASVENVHSIPGRVERPLNAVVNCEHSISDGFLFTLSRSPRAVRHVEQSVDDRAEQCRPRDSISSGRGIKSFLPVIYDQSNVSIQTVGKRMVLSFYMVFFFSFLSSFHSSVRSVSGFSARGIVTIVC